MIRASCITENCGCQLFDCEGIEHLPADRRVTCNGCQTTYRVKPKVRKNGKISGYELYQGKDRIGAVEKYG